MLKRIFAVKENENIEFWVSHSLVVFATIMGVYLAASAGFEKAIQFELLKSDRSGYYLRSAMRDELVDNINNIEYWTTDYTGGNARAYINHPGEYSLDNFIWQGMKYSSETFEIPTEIISSIRRFYIQAENGLEEMTSRNPDLKKVNKLKADAAKAKSEILPLIEKDLEILREKLRKAGIDKL